MRLFALIVIMQLFACYYVTAQEMPVANIDNIDMSEAFRKYRIKEISPAISISNDEERILSQPIRYASLSPDGSVLLYYKQNTNGFGQTYITELNTGKTRKLLLEGSNYFIYGGFLPIPKFGNCVWDPIGKNNIYFTYNTPRTTGEVASQIWRYDIAVDKGNAITSIDEDVQLINPGKPPALPGRLP